MKTRQFSLGSRCLVSMNLCLFFLICNSGHCLTRVIIKHHTMLRYHFFYLSNCLWIHLLLASFFFLPKKNLTFPGKKKKKKKHDWGKCLGLPYTRYGPASSWFVKYNSRFCTENTNFKYAVDTDEKKNVSLQKMIRLRAEETKEHNQDQPD